MKGSIRNVSSGLLDREHFWWLEAKLVNTTKVLLNLVLTGSELENLRYFVRFPSLSAKFSKLGKKFPNE